MMSGPTKWYAEAIPIKFYKHYIYYYWTYIYIYIWSPFMRHSLVLNPLINGHEYIRVFPIFY